MINKNLFFKPTTTYKEFVILDLIEKDSKITQRDISLILETSVSMVNKYLDELESKGYLIRKYYSTKTVEYFITSKGIERKKLLNLWYFKSSYAVYNSAKDNIISFLERISKKGFKKILLYGAGEVSQILINALEQSKDDFIKIVGIIDDNKKVNDLSGIKIIELKDMDNIEHDVVLIASYTHHEKMKKNLINNHYPTDRIIDFF